jgi:hypothetical protein
MFLLFFILFLFNVLFPFSFFQSTWYVALSCSVTKADVGLITAENFVPSNSGEIRCLTAQGYGTGHSLSVTIGADANARTSTVFAADISYAAPIVAVYSGAGSTDASTFGGQLMVVTGANFGPIGTPVDDAKYGEGTYQLDASCTVSIAHTELTCTTSEGAGKELKLVVTIGGQQSTIPAINYGAPELKAKVIFLLFLFELETNFFFFFPF